VITSRFFDFTPSHSGSTFALTPYTWYWAIRALEVMKVGISLPEDAPIIGVLPWPEIAQTDSRRRRARQEVR